MRVFSGRLMVLLVLFGMASCKQVFISNKNIQQFDYVLAEADSNYSLAVPEFYERLVRSEILVKGGILEKESVERILDSMIVDTLIGLRARDVDLRSNYNYYRRFRESYISILSDVYYKRAIFDSVSADSQEIADYIVDHPEEFTVEEQVLVYHIVISPIGLLNGADSAKYRKMPSGEVEDAAKQLAFELRGRIDSKQSYMEIARDYSHDELTARKGGLIDWAPREFYAWPFDSVAFAARPGEIVGPYRDKDGWQILYIAGYMAEGVPPLNPSIFAAARSKVVKTKTRDFSIKIFDTLFADIKVTYNEALYDSNVYLVDKEVWAAIVNEIDTIDFGELSTGEENLRQSYNVTISTAEMKRQLAKLMARRWVIVRMAISMGLDTVPSVSLRIESVRHFNSRLIVESEQTDPTWAPTKEMMREYYDKHLDEYTVEKPLKVQQIIVKDSLLAEFIRDQALAGIDLLQLADEFYPGEKSIRRQLADLGYIGPEDVSQDFYDAARVTRVGEVSRPVKTEFGYHIIKVMEKNWSKPFDKAAFGIGDILKKRHHEEVTEHFRDGLFEQFNARVTGRIYPVHLKPYKVRNSPNEPNGSERI